MLRSTANTPQSRGCPCQLTNHVAQCNRQVSLLFGAYLPLVIFPHPVFNLVIQVSSRFFSVYWPQRWTFGVSLRQGFGGLVPPNTLFEVWSFIRATLVPSFFQHTGHGEGRLAHPSVKVSEAWCLRMLCFEVWSFFRATLPACFHSIGCVDGTPFGGTLHSVNRDIEGQCCGFCGSVDLCDWDQC